MNFNVIFGNKNNVNSTPMPEIFLHNLEEKNTNKLFFGNSPIIVKT